MNPTELIKQAIGEPYIESERGIDWHAFNSGGVECEVGEFLYGLVKMIKPEKILETGVHKGISSSYMALALKENKRGILHTTEINEGFLMEAAELWKRLDVLNIFVSSFLGKTEDFIPKNQEYDLLFLDTEPNLRWGELERFYDNLKPGGYAFLHDLPGHFCTHAVNPDHPEIKNWPWGEIPPAIIKLMKDRELIPFSFMTPRSITGFYKPRAEDYKI